MLCSISRVAHSDLTSETTSGCSSQGEWNGMEWNGMEWNEINGEWHKAT